MKAQYLYIAGIVILIILIIVMINIRIKSKINDNEVVTAPLLESSIEPESIENNQGMNRAQVYGSSQVNNEFSQGGGDPSTNEIIEPPLPRDTDSGELESSMQSFNN